MKENDCRSRKTKLIWKWLHVEYWVWVRYCLPSNLFWRGRGAFPMLSSLSYLHLLTRANMTTPHILIELKSMLIGPKRLYVMPYILVPWWIWHKYCICSSFLELSQRQDRNPNCLCCRRHHCHLGLLHTWRVAATSLSGHLCAWMELFLVCFLLTIMDASIDIYSFDPFWLNGGT